MDRRRFLALSGLGISGLAGCTSPQESQQTSEHGGENGSTTTDATTTTFADRELEVEFSGLQTGVIELFEDAYEITSTSGYQYLFLDVTVTSGSPPSVTDFTFHFDGEAYTLRTEWDFPHPIHRGEESSRDYPDQTGEMPYRRDNDGWILFQLPERGDANDAVLSWPGGEWRPDEAVRARLANPIPSLTIEEWTVPETVSPDTNPEFEFTVRNEGTHPGHFWGAIDGDGSTTDRLVTLVSERILPGESESWIVTGRTSQMGSEEYPQEEVTYTLLWPGENRSRSPAVIYN